MFTFFRRIRKGLLSLNNLRTYIWYAIGEIALVVIGILIALQINTWNQGRLNKIAEKSIIENLNAEFRLNKDQFIKTYNRTKGALNSAKMLTDLVGSDQKELVATNIDSLLYNVFEYDNLTISENTLLDLVQSGRLQFIGNAELKTHIYQWTQQKKFSPRALRSCP